MRNLYIYIGAFVLFVFYTLFFTVKTGEEYLLLPKKVLEAPYVTNRFSGGSEAIVGLELADYAGFIGIPPGGDYEFSSQFYPKKGRVSLSSSALVFYNEEEREKKIISSSTLSKKNCQTAAWPLQLSGRLFFYDAAGSSFEERDLEGTLLWDRDINSFLTAISATKDLLLLGTVDGSCFLLDRSGAVVLHYTPEAGGFAVIAGAVLSEDGATLAIVSGTNPQKLEIFQLAEKAKGEELELILIHSEDLAISSGKPVKMFFEEEGSSLQLLLEENGGLREICLGNCDSSRLTYFGDLSQVVIDPLTGNKIFLSGTSEMGNISVYTGKEQLLYQEFFKANFRSVGELERFSFFSLNNTLLIVEKVYE